MERRSLLKILAAGALVERIQAQQPPKFEFFNAEQQRLVDRLAEMILPADDHSPGAREARVSEFIDLYVAHSPQEEKDVWRSGLELVKEEAQRSFGKPFVDGSPAEQDALMRRMAANEVDPSTDLERFFARLKELTVRGYYASPIGLHRELQYQGNVPLMDYPACDHAAHGTE